MDARDFFHAFGEDLGGAADGVEVNAAVIFASLDGFFAHAAFAYNAAQSEIANDLPLVRLFADGSGGAGSGDFPIALFVFHDDGATMVEDGVFEFNFGRKFAAFVKI